MKILRSKISRIAKLTVLSFPFFCAIFGFSVITAQEVTILDKKHYSNVLNEIRNYRVFLPPGYNENASKRYPVIYYYHGWSQRYFGSTSHSSYGIEKEGDNGGDNLANFVKDHEVIVIKPDGYNRNPDEEYYLRPYNVSPVETYRQFPLYFEELVKYIDDNYNTIPDREHRAISGLSMGGFMTYWIAGKYPHLVCAAGNFCGSTEFFAGPKNSPVEYRHLDMHENYKGVNVRLNYGNKDFIRAYHRDVNKVWTQVMDNYEYKIYDAAHSPCGLSEMYEFILETFASPPARPVRWGHTDIYPDFSVWDYEVKSDRALPGFTKLENVDANGFRIAVREFLPDGELMPFVNLKVKTAPVYETNSEYIVHDVDLINGEIKRYSIRSNEKGSLEVTVNGNLHEIGIIKYAGKPIVSVASVEIEDQGWATQKQDVAFSVKLVNKGESATIGLAAELEAFRNTTTILKDKIEFKDIKPGEVAKSEDQFVFHVTVDSLEIVKFKLKITDKDNCWDESFEIPLMTVGPIINEFEVADGRKVTIADAGDDVITSVLGNGNGDGIANPGESIVLLVKNGKKLWRTNLYTSDKWINPFGINNRNSNNWGTYDHVGGSEKYSIPLIASDCPEDHEVEFFAEYWLPDYPNHIIKRGKIKLNINGNDKTAPVLRWVQMQGDNTIQVKMHDGAKIQSVKANFTYKKELNGFFDENTEYKSYLQETVLNDAGEEGDRFAGDNVFSLKIPEQKFGVYVVEVEATDSFGNKMKEKWADPVVVH